MTQEFKNQPRRSALYTPGANVRALGKSTQSAADVFIIDLEDAVAPDRKHVARQNVIDHLARRVPDGRELIIRVNALDTPWCEEDVHRVAKLSTQGLLFPKISHAQDVARAEALMSAAGASPQMQLWCMIETPMSILNLASIAAERRTSGSRMTTWVMGTNDLAKDTGADPGSATLLHAVTAALTAARAYGLCILDGVYNDISDEAGLLAACRHARSLGFDGKTLIHPSQIAACNQVFTPTPEHLAYCTRILAAFAEPENAGKGVLKVDGKMVEILHAQVAERTLAMARATAQREKRA